MLPSPFGFPALHPAPAPVASYWDFAIVFLLVSASTLPESHTAMKMDGPRKAWPCHPPHCLQGFRCAAFPVEGKLHGQIGPSGSSGWAQSPLCFRLPAHTHLCCMGTAPALGSHTCVDGDGFSFWKAERTDAPRKRFRIHLDATFSPKPFWSPQPLALCKSYVNLLPHVLPVGWPPCTRLFHGWVVCAEGDHLVFLFCEMYSWEVLLQEIAILR